MHLVLLIVVLSIEVASSLNIRDRLPNCYDELGSRDSALLSDARYSNVLFSLLSRCTATYVKRALLPHSVT
eukprot:6177985-Pleurochrysis_carterae.AAC.1